jgi:hypothetical protein
MIAAAAAAVLLALLVAVELGEPLVIALQLLYQTQQQTL